MLPVGIEHVAVRRPRPSDMRVDVLSWYVEGSCDGFSAAELRSVGIPWLLLEHTVERVLQAIAATTGLVISRCTST